MDVIVMFSVGVVLAAFALIWLTATLIGLAVVVPAVAVAIGLWYLGVPEWLASIVGLVVALVVIGEIVERRKAKRTDGDKR